MANEKPLDLSTLQAGLKRYDDSLAKVAKSGNYRHLVNKPTIPVEKYNRLLLASTTSLGDANKYIEFPEDYDIIDDQSSYRRATIPYDTVLNIMFTEGLAPLSQRTDFVLWDIAKDVTIPILNSNGLICELPSSNPGYGASFPTQECYNDVYIPLGCFGEFYLYQSGTPFIPVSHMQIDSEPRAYAFLMPSNECQYFFSPDGSRPGECGILVNGMTNFVVQHGTRIVVKFTDAYASTDPASLQIATIIKGPDHPSIEGNSWRIPIQKNGIDVTKANGWSAGEYVDMIFDGKAFQII